jgi:hypothetical protein
MKRVLWVILGSLTAVTLLSGCKPQEPTPSPQMTTECQEDMPCWDCSTMGNGECGSSTKDL